MPTEKTRFLGSEKGNEMTEWADKVICNSCNGYELGGFLSLLGVAFFWKNIYVLLAEFPWNMEV